VTQTVADYQAAVQSEISNGIAELKAQVPTASMLAWVAPFNDAGQWTNLYNDPTTTDPTAVAQVQAWFPGYIASVFPIVFTETSPVAFAQAAGRVPDTVAAWGCLRPALPPRGCRPHRRSRSSQLPLLTRPFAR